MNRDYESYDETMARLTPAQLTALHEESVNLRTYVLEYYKATGFPARTRYVQFKISSLINFISRRNLLNFMFENGYLIREELQTGRRAEVCFPAKANLTDEDIGQGLYEIEMEHVENGSLPKHMRFTKMKRKPGRPKGSPNKRKKVKP